MAKYGFNVTIGADTRPFEKSMKNLSSKMQSLGKNMQKMSSEFKWISAAAAGALTGIVKISSDFEDSWVGVTKTVEGTAEELAKVKQEIIDMSKVTGISKNEIAGVAQAAGQLGIATSDLSSFTKVMVDLGIATNMSAEEAAMSLARFANITQMSSKDYDRLGATITDLGNNFAVTEREIVEMATRLASTGDLVGLSQAQIMALATAMGSLGSESEAGGTALSKMFRKMQLAIETNADTLPKFAKVAGVSVKEFKDAFEKDALGALNMFVKGLAKIEDSGGSAIATLDDMKLSEVRLSDALLRLVGSGDLLDRSIETANRAWQENTALTKEAAKRYDELKYQFGKLKETLGEVAIRLGDVLLPILKDVTKKATKWLSDLATKLGSMSKSERKNILEILAVIAMIAPSLKVAGKAIQTTGMIIKALTNPTNLAIVAIAGLVAATWQLAKAQQREIMDMNGLADVLEEERDAWNKAKEARVSAMDSAESELGVTQNLANELRRIVDENGKVKEGYEERAKFIVGALNDALGTEIRLNGNIIENYQTMQSELDNLIRKKKVEATLSAYAEEYATALKSQSKATDNLIELRKQLNEQLKIYVNSQGKERVEAQRKLSEITNAIQKEMGLVSEYGYTIQNYEALQTASISNSAEEMDKALTQMGISYEKVKISAEDSIDTQIQKQQESVGILKEYLSEAEKNHNDYQASVLRTQVETEEQQLDNLYKSLSDQTAAVTTLTPEQVKAFEIMANSDLLAYQKYVSLLPQEMQDELTKTTGIVTSNTSVENATGILGKDAADFFNINIREMPKVQSTTLGNVASTINSNTSVASASGSLGSKASTEFKTKSDTNSVGLDFVKGLAVGISSGHGIIGTAVSGLASLAISKLRSSLDEHSPSKEAAKIGKYFSQGFANGIIEGETDAMYAARNLGIDTLGALQMNDLKNRMTIEGGTKVVTPSIIINTQELDSQKLEQIVTYVDRKFGAAY